jgi:hypothetical protein
LVQTLDHLLNARLLEPLLQNRQTLVEGHPGVEQVGQLLGEEQQLTMRDFEI